MLIELLARMWGISYLFEETLEISLVTCVWMSFPFVHYTSLLVTWPFYSLDRVLVACPFNI